VRTMKKIIIKVKPNGEVEIDFQGFVGNQCVVEREKLLTMLSNLLNHEVKDVKLKPEFYQVSVKRGVEVKE